jgi:hypothetical protein
VSVSNAAIAQRLIRSLRTRDDSDLLKLERVYATRSSTHDRRIASAITAEIERRTSTGS